MMHKKTALIDGDIIVYSVGFAANREPLANALHSAKIMLRSILEETGADSFTVYLTGKDNYRESLATRQKYKGNRSGDKPVHYDALREYLIDTWSAEVIDGMEADDAMGIAQSQADKDTTVICTIDKDLNMISGLHYNWRTKKLFSVSQPEADLFFMKQLLTGDRTDNIRGIDQIGEKRASAVIRSSKSMSDLYWKILGMYEHQHKRPYDAMMENANLLWIQREEGVLWDSNTAEFAHGGTKD